MTRGSGTFAYAYVVASTTLATLAVFALPAFADGVRDDVDLSLSQVGLLTTALAVPYALAQVPGGLVGSVLGIGPSFAIAFGLVAAGFVASATLTSLPLLLASRSVVGIGAGMLLPLASALARTAAPEQNVRAQALLGSGWGLGYLVGLFALPLAFSDWRTAFACIAAGAAAAAAVALVAIPTGSVSRPGTALLEAKKAFSRLRVWLAAVCLLGMTFVNVGLGAWVTTFLREDRGLSAATTAWLTGLIGLGLLPASLAGAAAARGGRERRVVVASCVGLAAVTIGVAIGRPVGLLAVCLFALGWFSAYPFGVILAHAVTLGGPSRVETQGVLTGAVNGLSFVAGSVSPPLVGAIRDATGSFTPAFLALLIGPLIALAAAVRVFEPAPRTVPEADPV